MNSSPSRNTRSKFGKGLSDTQVLFSTSAPHTVHTVQSLLSPEMLLNNGKRELPTAGLPKFLGYSLVVLPIYLTTIFPTMIVSQVFSQASTLLLGTGVNKAQKSTVPPPSGTSADEIDVSLIVPLKERKYDVVILGFTGFTGRLAAVHLAKTYGSTGAVKWAVAGRNAEKIKSTIQSVIDEVGNGDECMAGVAIIEVDTNNKEQVKAMAMQTRVVCTTAGPFAKYGSNVVEACANSGTSYTDITGETEWVKEMIMLHGPTARKTGARILSLCGHDSIPWDASACHLADMLSAKGETVKSIVAYDEVKGAPSGGTIATIVHAVATASQSPKFQYDPLVQTADFEKSKFKVKNANVAIPKRVNGKWLGMFVMAECNVQAVKKSLSLKFGSTDGKMSYCEGSSHPDFMSAFCTQLELIMGMSLVLSAPLRALLSAIGGVPKPGQGPSKKTMENGWLRVHMQAEGSKGSEVESVIYFPRDAGYRDTSRMLVEAGLCMALESDKLTCEGGIYTPGFALGDVLLDRLKVGGTIFAASENKGQSKL